MKFKVGDVCVTRACSCHPEGNRPVIPFGSEITILAVDADDPSGMVYETDILFGKRGWQHYWARECYLELKQPPQREPIGEWADCPWWPQEVIV